MISHQIQIYTVAAFVRLDLLGLKVTRMSLRPANHVLKLAGPKGGQLHGSSISLSTFKKGCVSKLEAVLYFCKKGLYLEVIGKKK